MDDVDGGLLVVNNNRVDLFVVGAVGDAIAGLVRVLTVNVAHVPSDETLPIVREILPVVVLSDVGFDLFVHLVLRISPAAS